MVSFTILPHHPGPVQTKDHGQFLQADIMQQLVISALQEGRIDGYHGLNATRSQPGGKCDSMLLRYADIVQAPR